MRQRQTITRGISPPPVLPWPRGSISAGPCRHARRRRWSRQRAEKPRVPPPPRPKTAETIAPAPRGGATRQTPFLRNLRATRWALHAIAPCNKVRRRPSPLRVRRRLGLCLFFLSKQAAARNATATRPPLSSQEGKGMGIGEANAMREEKHHPSCLCPALQTGRPATLKLSSLLVLVCARVFAQGNGAPIFSCGGVREVVLFAPV
ncbi:hypothetical protein TraAM80_01556 [Trypanosoma rangeli]|uniref:Uncharacterized protein n=1 Tax=Trypanosoma rangeli TaxID=5698 RepID=A0A3R7P029_TRYRA|nr:uncharacterized protein TraAM80_01556 [Trypanosoma rangeli]RNF10509.1 hypothetical protein TraAM80_01556 [Trypanosoma rangeli]|eukprot:RNF10509.1 hypothetical protein TraAM80_01556 [Trypanosoma rangeli]